MMCRKPIGHWLCSHALAAGLLLLAVATLPSCTSDTPPVKALALHTPRAFGYVIGDRIRHRISLTVAHPFVLEKDALPQTGPLNQWLDLTKIQSQETRSLTQRHYELYLTYQIFKGVKAPETATIPSVALRLHNGDNSVEVSTPEWSFSMAPLIPSGTKDAAVEIRPALATPQWPVQPHLWLLAAMTCGVMVIVLYCAWSCDWLPFLHRRPGPFTRACRSLKKLRDRNDSDRYRAALRVVHAALNELAGETVFAKQLDRLYARQPALKHLRSETEAFLAVSRQIFFDPAEDSLEQDYPLQRLQALCQQYRKKENALR